MGPVSLVVGHRQELDLRPCFIGWLRRETGYGPTDRSADVLWIVSGAIFSREEWDLSKFVASHEGLLYVDYGRYIWSWTIRGLSVRSVWCVGRVFPCRVYIDLSRRDSQI
jgi:hypothetical protein